MTSHRRSASRPTLGLSFLRGDGHDSANLRVLPFASSDLSTHAAPSLFGRARPVQRSLAIRDEISEAESGSGAADLRGVDRRSNLIGGRRLFGKESHICDILVSQRKHIDTLIDQSPFSPPRTPPSLALGHVRPAPGPAPDAKRLLLLEPFRARTPTLRGFITARASGGPTRVESGRRERASRSATAR